MNVKEYIFSRVTQFPNWLNFILMKINVFPGIIFGKQYLLYKQGIKSNDEEQSVEKLLQLVNHALVNVKYYRERYPNLTISSMDEFKQKFTFIDKDIVMQDLDAFISDDIDMQKFIKGTTGGTSGKPLQLLIPKNRHIVELGTVHSYWEKYGYRFSPRAVLRNHKLDGKSFQINPITKEIIFDGFNLTDENFSRIYQIMQKYKIAFLQCYPSSGYALAKYISNNNLDIGSIRAFFVSSENVLDYQKKFIKSLGIKLFSLYGHSEKLVIAGTCPYHDYYHVEPHYGYMELIDSNGNVIEEPGILGEIVGTTFNNFGMPLIRYKTGDFAQYIDVTCECGFSGKTLSYIKGRWNGEKIYNADGTFVTTTALNLHGDIYSVIDGLQYIQKKKGYLEVNVIPGQLFNDEHEDRILTDIQSKMNEDSVISIRRVNALMKQPNGKFLLLLSEVDE